MEDQCEVIIGHKIAEVWITFFKVFIKVQVFNFWVLVCTCDHCVATVHNCARNATSMAIA